MVTTSEPIRRVITLVHGTWAVDAPWTQEGSKLRTSLAGALPGTVFGVSGWKGFNSHAARRAGGLRLRNLLADSVLKDHPHAAHYLIAHSHGGNVVRRALRDLAPADKERIRGVVCLATPFITVAPRDLEERRKGFRGLVHNKGIFLLGAVLLLAPVLEFMVLGKAWWLKMLGALVLSGYVVTWLGDAWRERLLGWLERSLPSWQQQALDELRTATPPNPPLLAIEPDFDEPGTWLRFVQRVAELPFRLRVWFVRLCGVLGASLAIWSEVIAPAVEAGELSSLWTEALSFDPLFMWVLTAGIGGTVGAAIGFALAELGRWLVPTAVKSRNYGFGRAPWYFNYLTDIRVDRLPEEFDSVTSETITVQRQGLGTRHSAIYSSDAVLARIAEFIDAST